MQGIAFICWAVRAAGKMRVQSKTYSGKMGSNKKLVVSVILGTGFILGMLVIPIWSNHLAYAAGPRYVAPSPLGSDIGNDCLSNLTPCATVQYAVDQADSGEEIRVAAGTYTGVVTRVSVMFTPLVVTQTVYISKPLIVRGGYTTTNWSISNPLSNPTVLDAQGQGRVFNIENTTTITSISIILEGLFVTNGNATGQPDCWGGRGGGGGIHGCSVTATVMSNYIFNNNGSYAGGGVSLIGYGPLTLLNNRITTNTVTSYNNIAGGGGAAVGMPGLGHWAMLEGNIIRGNKAIANGPDQITRGGGLMVAAANVMLKNNIVQSNTAEAVNGARARGGGIDFDGGLSMTNTVIIDNHITGSGDGAGMYLFTDDNLDAKFWHTTIAHNSGGDGSGIHLVTSTLAMTNSIVVSHSIGITVGAASTATLNSILWFNNTITNITGTGVMSLNNQLTGDPAFRPDGYHLGLGSMAFDQGLGAGVTTDIDNETRSLTTPDLGADEGSDEGTRLSFFLPVILKN